jgi:hypothetical protein
MRPPKSGLLLLASGAIGERYDARIAFLRKAGTLCLLAFVVFHMLTTFRCVVPLALGTDATANVIDMQLWRGKNGYNHRIRVETGDGRVSFSLDIDGADYAALQDAPHPVTVPLRRVGDSSFFSYAGRSPGVFLPFAVWGFLGWAFALFAIAYRYRDKHAWYDRIRLIEYGGSGPHPDG